MRFALMTEPQQGISYEEILAIAGRPRTAGFEAFFRSDHYTSFPGEAGCPRPTAGRRWPGWRGRRRRSSLGALVSPVTFRIPGAFAKLVTTVDEMSGGRVEVGVGAGWNDLEHAQLGLPFPDVKERVDMLEEELIILRGLWDEPDGWSLRGGALAGERVTLRPRADRIDPT